MKGSREGWVYGKRDQRVGHREGAEEEHDEQQDLRKQIEESMEDTSTRFTR